jgi:hypothetical protein
LTSWREATPPFAGFFTCEPVLAGMSVQCNVAAVLLEVVPEETGLASGVVSSTLQIGSARLGSARLGSARLGARHGSVAPSAYALVFQISLAINAVLMFVCIGLSVPLVRHPQMVLRRVAQPV